MSPELTPIPPMPDYPQSQWTPDSWCEWILDNEAAGYVTFPGPDNQDEQVTQNVSR